MRLPKRTLSFFVLFAALAASLAAQSVESDRRDLLGRPVDASAAPPERAKPEAWGVANDSVQTIAGVAFVPGTSTTGFIQEGGTARRLCTTGPCFFNANLTLPPGAQVTAIELDGCNDDATGDLTFGVGVCPGSTASCSLYPPVAGATTSGTPGCGRFTGAIRLGPIVDRRNDTFFVALGFGSTGTTLKARAVRVFYRLRLSDGPAIPSFGDVPTTHLFYKQIEALFAAGITTGCGGGNFCPAQAVTRGEMAAFLAKALGLYFPF